MQPDDMDRRANELVATGAVFQVLSSWVGTLKVSDLVDNSMVVHFDFMQHAYRVTVTMEEEQ